MTAIVPEGAGIVLLRLLGIDRIITRTGNFTYTGLVEIVIDPENLATARLGEVYSQIISARGGEGPYIYTALSPLPEGLVLNENTGEISGVPRVEGVFPVSIRVTDAGNASAERSYGLFVASSQIPAQNVHAVPSLSSGSLGALVVAILAGMGIYRQRRTRQSKA